jgi:hypothetical protein
LARLKETFDVEEDALTSHLGTNYHFNDDRTKVVIEQSAQAEKMLKEFRYADCNPAAAPVSAGMQPPNEQDALDPPKEPFDMEALVGHMTYLYMCTRPDVGYALKVLSRFARPGTFGKRHVQWAHHLLRYVRGTKAQGLTFESGFPLYAQIFTDASHANDADTRRSITSIVIKVGGNTVYWKNSFSKIVCHSSTESELMALDVGATLSEMVRWLIQAMGGPIQDAIQLFVDNQATIDISSNPVQSGRNLHVHARYYYVRDLVYNLKVRVEKISTSLQIADVGCSHKGTPNFLTLRNFLMNCARVVSDESEVFAWEMHPAQAH